MVLGNEISLICGRNFIVVESFSGQLSGADGCNGILLLETAIGVVGIWWSVPIGWALADIVGLMYYKIIKRNECEGKSGRY